MTSSEQRAIAAELADELTKALGPMPPEALTADDGEIVREVFGRVFDSHGIFLESVGAQILSRVPRLLAKAERNRRLDAAMRERLNE